MDSNAGLPGGSTLGMGDGAADTGGGVPVGRRGLVAGALAVGVGLSGFAGPAASRGPDVAVEFLDCVTVRVAGDVGTVSGLHFHVWNSVDAVDDHLLVEDLGSLSAGTTLANGLRVRQFDEEGLVLALNTPAYNYVRTADVYLSGPPDFFGDGADVSASNPCEAHVALTGVAVADAAYDGGDRVTATATVVNVSDRPREVFLGFSAVGPDGRAYTNDRTTGTALSLSAGETMSVDLAWTVEADAPEGRYDAHVAVWREADRDALQTRYDERYVHGAFAVGSRVDASIEGLSPPTGTFGTGQAVRTDVTVRNTGASRHTFFVGYSAIGPDGLAYTNEGTTGRPATLAPGETRTVTVEWVVEGDAPRGLYEAHVAVWRESAAGDLQTLLDERRAADAFEVV